MESNGFGIVPCRESDEFYCPKCGERINAKGFTAEVGYSATVPLSLDLSIIDRGDKLDVQFEYDTVYADGDTGMIYKVINLMSSMWYGSTLNKENLYHAKETLTAGNVENRRRYRLQA